LVPHTLIELDRKFLPVSDKISGEVAVELFRLSGRAETWADLLKHPSVVVLGETGIGKTAELRAQADHLRRAGRTAFFLPIESVAQRGVKASLTLDEIHLLRDWTTAVDSEAWFMLDSVDESKLKGHTLSTAVNTFAQELEEFLPRIHTILSSRASDWRSSDEAVVTGLAKHLYPSGSAGEERHGRSRDAFQMSTSKGSSSGSTRERARSSRRIGQSGLFALLGSTCIERSIPLRHSTQYGSSARSSTRADAPRRGGRTRERL
jgi:hypothetical protein